MAFRTDVAKQLPKFPNDKATLQTLQKTSVGELLIHAANWLIRYVRPCPRAVRIEPTVKTDSRWAANSDAINALLAKIGAGTDLTPHLSRLIHTRGYTPAAAKQGTTVDRWADKDMLLNIMGYHHLHLQTNPPSDLMLFAQITRTDCDVVALANHSVFEQNGASAGVMTPERKQLWDIFDERTKRGAPPGAVVIPTLIATSGHPYLIVRRAQEYAQLIELIDPNLDDREYVKSLYSQAGLPPPSEIDFEWCLYFLDFGLLNKKTKQFLLFRNGPN